MRLRNFLYLVCLVMPAAVEAHNGAVAIAVPLEEITIDGDLSDWPAEMRRYPIRLQEVGERLKGVGDFRGAFRIGYHAQENALYVGVEVEDDSVVEQAQGAMDWHTQDGCEVFVEVGHHKGEGTPAQWKILGHTRQVFGAGKAEDARVEVRWGERRYSCEWRLELDRLSQGQYPLGRVVGLDVAVCDKDADGSFSWMAWGEGGIPNKVDSADRLGDVVVGGKEGLGKVQGQVRWEDREEGLRIGRVVIQSLSGDSLWVTSLTDSSGGYEVEVPAGAYRVETGYRRKTTGVEVEVKEGEIAPVGEVFFPRPPLVGVEVKAGKGKTTRAGAGSRQGAWHTLDGSDGFPLFVRSIFQDQQGYLWLGGSWIGSAEGVSRYDGQYLQTFTAQDGLPHDEVNSIFQDREGNWWFGTNGGVSRYDGRQFKTFTAQDGLAGNNVGPILQDREGKMWFGTWGGGVSRYDGERFQNFTTQEGLADNLVSSILQDREGKLWFGTNGGVSQYDGRQWTTFTTQEGLAGNIVSSILQDREGKVWLGTEGGVSRYDGQQFKTFTTQEGLADNDVRSVFQDWEGNWWFGTWRGLSRYDGQHFQTFTTQEGLADNIVWSIFQDREGNLWFGTDGGGVSRYSGQQFQNFTTLEGLVHNLVRSILRDREGKMWFGTEGGGVSRYDGQQWKSFTTQEGLVHNTVLPILQDRGGNLWFGTLGGGVSRYDGQRFQSFTVQEGLANNTVSSILQDREGKLWFGTYGGVSRYDLSAEAQAGGRQWKTFTTQDGLADNRVNAILQDREGKMWFGGWGGMSRYDLSAEAQAGGQRFQNFAKKDGLLGNIVMDILQDQSGDLWFGTWGGGVNRYDGQQFKTFTTQDGLASNWVWSIWQDREGKMWFGTNGGVSQYDGQRFQTLVKKDGLSGRAVLEILQDQSGDLWFGTDKGVTRFRPPPPSPPPVFIDAVVADQRYEEAAEVEIPSTVARIAFEFHGISFKTRPEAMVYLYRLQGYEEDWKSTHERRVEYQDVPMGDYTFKVKVVDRDLNYSEEPATVRVTVHLPYERYGLFAALGLALLLIAWQGMRLVQRDRVLQTTNQALQQKTSALGQANQTLRDTQAQLVQAEKLATVGLLAGGVAHEINNPLQAILQGAQRILKYPEDLQRHRQSASLMEQAALRCSAIVQNLLSYTRRSGGEFAPVDLNEVVGSTLALLQSHLEQAGIAVRVEKGEAAMVEGNFNELCTVLTNLLMNARDALVAKGGQGIVEITTAAAGGEVVLRVRDNGPGIPAELRERIFDPFYTTKPVGSGTGLGLSIVQGIAQRHRGRIEVESGEGGGTAFTVYLPILIWEPVRRV